VLSYELLLRSAVSMKVQNDEAFKLYLGTASGINSITFFGSVGT
jgi:hypothetical protein